MSDYDLDKVRHFDTNYYQQPQRAGWVSAPPPPPAPRRKPVSAPPAPTTPEEFRAKHGHNDTHPDHLDDEEYTAEHHYRRHHHPPADKVAEARAFEFGKAYYGVRKQMATIAKATYEPPPEMVYNANVADASYAFYYKDEERLAEIEEATGLKIDPELSDRYSVVLHDSEGNAYISYRGTDPKNPQDLAEDWRIFTSKTIKKGEGMTPRLASAEAKYIATASKYKVIGVSGHSLGGHQSLHIAEKYGVEGFHYNPAVSYEQAFNQSGFSKVKQMIFRNPDDPVSLWAGLASAKNKLTGRVPNPNRVVHHTPITTSAKDSHGLDNFTKAKRGELSASAVEEGGARGIASKAGKAVVKRGGELLAVAFAVAVAGEDIADGKSASETGQDVFETIIPVEGDEYEGKVRRYRMEQENKEIEKGNKTGYGFNAKTGKAISEEEQREASARQDAVIKAMNAKPRPEKETKRTTETNPYNASNQPKGIGGKALAEWNKKRRAWDKAHFHTAKEWAEIDARAKRDKKAEAFGNQFGGMAEAGYFLP